MTARVLAPAKVNLVLRVRERDATGYHPLETLFCALELADELTIEVGDGSGVRLEVDGPDLGPAEDNLAVRAARAFLDLAGIERATSIRLRKRIPAGGGLGGGSSDAAAVFRALDRAMPGAVAPAALEATASGLGRDIPFFLAGAAMAWGTGYGDRVRAAVPLPSAPVVLLIPPLAVSTAAAYGWLDSDRAAAGRVTDDRSAEPSGVEPLGWDGVAELAENDFEAPVFARHPRLRELRDVLRTSGASVALLSGSGSTVFGVFPDDDRARGAQRDLRARLPDVRCVLTRTASR